MKLTTFAFALASVSLTAFGQVPAPPPAPRLLCMYLDLGSLSPADLATAQDQAIKFVVNQATSSDQIAIMTYSAQVNVLQDFTNDHDKLVAALRAIMPGEVTTPDDASARLQGIQAAATTLGALPQKKAMIYFSSGVLDRNPNTQAALSATVDSLMRANISLYPVDARGLITTPR